MKIVVYWSKSSLGYKQEVNRKRFWGKEIIKSIFKRFPDIIIRDIKYIDYISPQFKIYMLWKKEPISNDWVFHMSPFDSVRDAKILAAYVISNIIWNKVKGSEPYERYMEIKDLERTAFGNIDDVENFIRDFTLFILNKRALFKRKLKYSAIERTYKSLWEDINVISTKAHNMGDVYNVDKGLHEVSEESASYQITRTFKNGMVEEIMIRSPN